MPASLPSESPAGLETAPTRSFRRWPALLVSLVLIALTVSPALRDPPLDSFPLSTYPMFSTLRKTSWIHVIVGFDAEGNERKIPPSLVANFEVMQAAQTIRRAVRAKRAKQLCEQVAGRVGADADFSDLVRLEVQSRRFEPLRYFVAEDGRVPTKQRRRARCTIARGESVDS